MNVYSSNQSPTVPKENLANLDYKMPDLSKQRSAFLRAEKTAWKMDNDDLADAIRDLADYPLVPYLIERKLSDKLRLSDEPQIRMFLNKYKDSPLAYKVRQKWLKLLAKKKQITLFTQYYERSTDTKLRCIYIDFQIQQGINETRFYKDISDLWTVGKSQPKECDGIFKKWINANQLNDEQVLLRIKKAADGGRHTLIPYLRSLLPQKKQYLADLWHKTRRNPAYVRNIKRFKGAFPKIEAEIMSYGLSRLIWRDQALAQRIFKTAQNKMSFTQAQKARVYGRFGIKLAIDGHKNAQEWLAKAEAVGNDSELTRWHLANLLRNKAWTEILLLIENSDPQKVGDNVYSYWLARAYEELGRNKEAKVLYEQLAQSRHYYGFLASAKLDKPYQLEHASVKTPMHAIKKALSLSSTARAYELRLLGRYHEARLEWRQTQNALNDNEKLASAIIASEWEWHDQAIFTFAREGYLSDIPRRFPTAFKDIITREANKNNIESQWAFAIARRESSFMSDAVSSANARGLMQVLPSTAKYLEKKRFSAKQLLDVETNARLGNKYLRYLMNKVDNNMILATASYNAGWRRVKQWLPAQEAMPADIWVELIPFKETRNYVKAVMAYQQIYEAQLKDNRPDEKPMSLTKAKVFIEFLETDIPVSL